MYLQAPPPNYIKQTGQNQTDTIFADSFESGDLSSWTYDGNILSVTPAAAYWGNYSLQAVIDGNNNQSITNSSRLSAALASDNCDSFSLRTNSNCLQVLRNNLTSLQAVRNNLYSRQAASNNNTSQNEGFPLLVKSYGAESHFRARFYINPNGVSLGTNDVMILSLGLLGNEPPDIAGGFVILMQKVGDTYQVNLTDLYSDGGMGYGTQWYDLTDLTSNGEGWSAIEIEYLSGQMSLWVDGTFKETLNTPENSGNGVVAFALGAYDLNQATSGTIYIDDFDSRRNSYIGLLADPGVHIGAPTPIPGMANKRYSYTDATHVHAVTGLTDGTNSDSYSYDANGNMTCRVEGGNTYNQVYNADRAASPKGKTAWRRFSN